MANISIETSQNVTIDHNIASVGERMLAQLIDYAVFFVYYMLIVFLFMAIKPRAFSTLIILISLPVLLYSFLLEVFFNGQTIGKMVLKIRVIRLDGGQPTISGYFLRWILRFVDVTIFSGLVAIITIIVNGKGQRIGDIAAGTTVISLKAPVRIADTIHMHLTGNYEVRFPEVENLTDNDILTLKDVLKHLNAVQNSSAKKMTSDAKSAIERKLKINSGLDPKSFLKTVIRDYNCLHKGM